jgi:hypothetical protein
MRGVGTITWQLNVEFKNMEAITNGAERGEALSLGRDQKRSR